MLGTDAAAEAVERPEDELLGSAKALKGVDLTVSSGEVHALIGENGAGKSTLMHVLAGEIAPNAGEIRIGGTLQTGYTPRVAASCGIAVIHQETALAPDLSVAENVFLGDLPGVISWPALNRRAGTLLARLGFAINPRATVGDLAVAHQQIVEIAKALSQQVRVIVFDEPTAVLSTQDAGRLHRHGDVTPRRNRQNGREADRAALA